ncbi:MAG: DMT family transporter [Ignavibacteriae bacterium]|nr:DMT family transporter [Ignavibacteriota bacterium]
MKTQSKAEVALFATTVIWGSTFVVQKIGLRDITPLLLNCFRFSLASFFFLLFWKRIFPLSATEVLKGSILGLFLFLGFAFQTIGLEYTTASKSAFITSMMVVFVPLLQFIIEKRPPTVGNLIGVTIVSVGLWLLTSPADAAFNIGDSMTLMCAVVFGLYIVYLDVVSKEMGTLPLAFTQTTASAFFSLLALMTLEESRVTFSSDLSFSILYLTFMATILALFIQTKYQKETTPTRAVVIFTIEPVFAALIAYAVLDEQLGVAGILGAGVIITGILLSEFSDSLPLLKRSFAQNSRGN